MLDAQFGCLGFDFGSISPGDKRLETLLHSQSSDHIADETRGTIQQKIGWYTIISFRVMNDKQNRQRPSDWVVGDLRILRCDCIATSKTFSQPTHDW